ncbi:SLC13 family permease [Methylotuvimicrobium alcaliphilum]|uniref:TrkA-C, di-and tricarboxylate transporters n=1 Tax=Methylotuvimicrobium alcaliphilum (strain DSM 19304 / NCIMB 14124 / VKM B-2133 / 20Z) TaxID=1091494 RepID=G4T131_META2|nr:SLC13 family permease [Methylotuvimicrobium alcaliphilum]CCE24562.1 TrkA-C, di-and tricarboxylate transporters [Methylotuvimicrobium alcaliphilum 20Z]
MDWQGWLTIFLTLGVLTTLVFSRLTPDIVLMAALTVLSVCGVLDAKQALSGFSNEGLITVAAMFIIAAGIRASGGVELIVNLMLGNPKSLRSALFRLVLPIIPLSAFLNNTPVVATMIPAVTRWSKRIGVSPSKLMIPLSYAAILGGTLTLIGTSTNLVINGQYQVLTGKSGFGLFDITMIGLPVAFVGILFIVFVLPLLLPQRQSASEQFADRKKFTFEVAVAINGPLEGVTIAEAGLRNLHKIYLAEVERNGSIVTAVSSEEKLQGGDRLVFVGETSAIFDILRTNGLVPSDNQHPVIEKDAPERCLVEAVVSPHCDSIGTTIRDSQFRDRYGAVVLAVARNGEPIQGNLGSIELQAGDVLLLEARPAFVTRQRVQRDFLMINDLAETRPNHSRANLSWALLLGVIILATSGLTSMLNAALIGAGAMVATGCCSINEARRSLDLTVIVTIAASFALGNALQISGAADFIARHVLSIADGNAWLLLGLTYIIVSIMTEVITNNAAALLMLPIVLAITGNLGLNPEPFVFATMVAASASFATPIGYQTNLMVYGPGGYHFKDFLKVGVPMNIIIAITSIGLIPFIWPLSN